MIVRISGKLIEKKPTEIVVDVHGVGYGILIPASSYEALPAVGVAVQLYTHYYVREDAALLFGFASQAERALFRIMMGVSGIGPKLALAALSAMRPAELRDHILSGDVSLLTRIPGVGRKTAERLIIELRDRVAELELPGVETAALRGTTEAQASARADARAALESLGLSRASAEQRLRRILRKNPEIASAEEMIRLALREQ